MEIVLLAKSSTHPEEPYKVTFRPNDGKLQVLCTCTAGHYGQFCKHKASLVLNDSKMLFDTKQKEQLGQVQKWVQASSLLGLLNEVHQAEKGLEDMKNRLKNLKAMVGRVMTEGLK